MLFQKRFWDGIADGSVTVTFRRWKRPQAVAGRRQRTPVGFIEIDDVTVVDPGGIRNDEAIAAGHATADALRADLPGTADLPTYRITFHFVGGPDPRAELANDADLSDDDVSDIDKRLARMDEASPHGPWTHAMLATIATHPERRAGDLAAMHGRERLDFKKDVRKLKNLGLTLSFNPGYRLSRRGQAYLDRTKR